MLWSTLQVDSLSIVKPADQLPGHVHSAQIVRVGHEKVFLARGNQLVQYTRMVQCIVQITMTGRVPVLLVIVCGFRRRQERLLEDTWVPRLIERGDSELLVGILLDDAKCVLVSVERGHQNEWDIDAVRRVQMLDLTHGKIEEGHVILDLERRLGPSHT